MHNFHEKVEGTDPDLLDEFARRRVESKGLNTIVSTPLRSHQAGQHSFMW